MVTPEAISAVMQVVTNHSTEEKDMYHFIVLIALVYMVLVVTKKVVHRAAGPISLIIFAIILLAVFDPYLAHDITHSFYAFMVRAFYNIVYALSP